MRRSSRGNPWHDERGRFCSGPSKKNTLDWLAEHEQAYEDADRHFNGVKKASKQALDDWIAEHKQLHKDYQRHFKYSEKTEEEYAERTRQRLATYYVIGKGGQFELTTSNEVKEGMLVEYAPGFCGEGEEKFVHIVVEERSNPVDESKKRYLIKTVNSPLTLGSTSVVDEDMIQPAAKEKVDVASREMELRRMSAGDEVHATVNGEATTFVKQKDGKWKGYRKGKEGMEATDHFVASNSKSMPWQTDGKYIGKKNAQLIWLMDHPDSKYNSPHLISGIKRIEALADNGVPADFRQKQFSSLCKKVGISEEEGRYFIEPEFLA